jgi:hypothetical protein
MIKIPVLFSLLFSISTFLRAQDSLIIATISENIHTVQFNGGQLTGPGVKILQQVVDDNQFVMIGEMHGIREVGDFSEALFNMGKKVGFKYFSVETDPWVADKLEDLARQPMDSLAAFEQSIPFTIPFYANSSDFSFLQSVVDGGDDQVKRLWGLDQTFVAATRFLLHEIMDLATSARGKSLAQYHYNKAVPAFMEAMSQQNPQNVYLHQLTEEDFAELTAAFTAENNSKALDIIHGLKTSQHIYHLWQTGKYHQNNRVRSLWMKEIFMSYYNEALARDKDLPKVMFKFGSNHAVRGLTPVHIYDLGNMISELAESSGQQSCHIMFTAIKGQSFNMLAGPQNFDNTNNYDSRIMQALGDKINGRDWLVIDLRPLRNTRMKNESEAFKSTVFGFDFWIISPEATPLKPF